MQEFEGKAKQRMPAELHHDNPSGLENRRF
jgi:hypothetical protein